MSDSLPSSWVVAPLSDVAEIVMGQSPDSSTYNDKGNGLPFFQGKAEFGSLYPTVRKWCSALTKIAESGDILLSVRAPVGPTNLAPDQSCIGRGLAAIRAYRPIDQKYLLHHFRAIEPWLSEQGTGTTFKAISGEFIRLIEVSLAPINEQHRIADKLDQTLAIVERASERLRRVPGILKRFRQSVLAAATDGRLTEDWRAEQTARMQPQAESAHCVRDSAELSYQVTPALDVSTLSPSLPEWATVRLGELVVEGPTNGLYKHVSAYGEGIPILRIDMFYEGEVRSWQRAKKLNVTSVELERYGLAVGDIVINRVNSPSYVGKSALIRRLPEPSVFESNMMRLRIDSNRLLPEYCIRFLSSPVGLVRLRKNVKHAVNQSSINQSDVQSVFVELPSIQEQTEIVRRVEALFALADRMEARHQAALARVEKLTQALLAKAFRGELVPQDPADEPAAALLERIRAARQSVGTKPRRKRNATTDALV